MELRNLAKSVEADLPRFLRFMQVQSLADLPAAKFDAAVKALESKTAC